MAFLHLVYVVRDVLRINAKFEPASVNRIFCRSIWTVCTTCTISLLPGIMKVKKTSTIDRELSKTTQNYQLLTTKRIRKAPYLPNILKLAKSSSAFGQRPLLTLINDSLSLNFMDIFLSSSWICVQSRTKHWPRFVKISCQKISAPRKSPKGWPLTFWSKVWHVSPSLHLPLEYEVTSLYIENIHTCSYYTRNNGFLWVIMTLTFKRVNRNSMCSSCRVVVPSRICFTKP